MQKQAHGFVHKLITGSCLMGALAVTMSTQAATLTYTSTQPVSTTEWSYDFTLAQFDPSLGTLNSVYLSAQESMNISGTVLNRSATAQDFYLRAGSLLTVTLPGSLGTLEPTPMGDNIHYTLGSESSAGYGPYSRTISDYTTVYGSDMLWFKGLGDVTLPGFTMNQLTISGGGGNIDATLATTAGATVTVIYDYTPVPEPGTVALLALGGLALWLRRK